MSSNRYLNAVLTIIAVELGWLALTHAGVPVTAQQAATPVVITGIELEQDDTLPVAVREFQLRDRNAFLPVAVFGQVENPPQAARFQPIDIRASAPLKVDVDRPIRIAEPVTVRIPVTSSPRPGQ
jgi:hypothetical protein